MKEEARKIIENDKAFENVLESAMERVGKERDQKTLADMKKMDEEDFRKMIEGMKGSDITVDVIDNSLKTKIVSLFADRTILKIAVACIIAIVAIGIVHKVDMGAGANKCASMFEQYAKYDGVRMESYKVGDNSRVNIKGFKSTAAILEESAKKICEGSIRDTKEGVADLKTLLTLNYKKNLEPEIHWYIALGYLKLNDTSAAKLELDMVNGFNSLHKNEAVSILKQIGDR